jgi:dTDP-4-amino-4,6-dideoxygalactose transaminase
VRIEKLASRADQFRRPYRIFHDARSAFKAVLRLADLKDGQVVLLPAYIGWSSREGSGVFDPIAETGLPFAFYRLDDRLNIDLEHLHDQLEKHDVAVLVIIHYFGYVDRAYPDAVAAGRLHGAFVLEDEAHALFTDLVAGASGRLGDACIFSLHKMLPVGQGGMLMVHPSQEHLLETIPVGEQQLPLPWEYDLSAIADARRSNAKSLAELLKSLEGEVDPLWEDSTSVAVPQTFPVIVRHRSRDILYHEMNESGFGAVSLYHTLISEIPREQFPSSYRVAKRILNLPVHQDIHAGALEAMVELLHRHIDSR